MKTAKAILYALFDLEIGQVVEIYHKNGSTIYFRRISKEEYDKEGPKMNL